MKRISLVIGLLVACTVDTHRPDWKSGGDHKRDLAKLAPLGRAITDSLNAKGGDHTDWRYAPIPGDGTLTLRISVDNPRAPATIRVVDDLGRPLFRERLNGRDTIYTLEERVEKGKVFIQIQTQKYETVYTIKTDFVLDEVETPEPKPEPKRVRRKRPKKEPAPAPTPVVQDAIIIVGKVLNKIAWDEGKKTRITFNKGHNDGVKAGATAVISGGPTMTVKEVFEEASVGIAKVKAGRITEGTKVTITVRESTP